ncbi:Gfo/Idh/MocA family oxidoreductase [Rubellicoccus peritrichatus]|uniref:Gfo/Idh/MocA family oxidoreductase n=1 Tax=Rubellicoccus peritrichatus TaxID=3080537 RepID=A0AAQ3LBX0_9BACT|nr:Gfo/Idh/MocA family oxidoreductase [Puniceicoccus sp. CR14]WOO41557.1 Gfo/Idh/MocA family oxidoreductase [Puniceicoccus sp. CR14]
MKTVAVIGCGKFIEGKVGWAIGHAHASGYTNCGIPVRLTGVDLSAENLEAFGNKFNVPTNQLFTSTDALYGAGVPDVVSICTWPGLHAPMAIEAMERGVKGLIIEKPLALDVDQINAIRQKAKETNTVISVAHQRRHEPAFQTFKKIIETKRLGEQVRVEACVGGNWDVLSWTTHWFDMANFLLGETPQYMLAGMDVTDKRIYGHACENASIVFAEYSNGNSGVFLTGPLDEISVRLTGPNGIAMQRGDDILVCTSEGVETIPLETGHEAFRTVCAELLQAIDGGPEPLCSLKNCAVATEMAYAAQESARTQRKVELPVSTGFAPIELMQHPTQSLLRRKRVLVYADAHFGSGGREGLTEAIESLTETQTLVIDAEQQSLTQADTGETDFIVIYHTQKEANSETRNALEKWVNQGKPLIIVHAGLGAWPEWNTYHEWCGLIWEWGKSSHPHSPINLEPETGNPLNFNFGKAWLPRDEVFVQLKSIKPVTIGLHARLDSGESYPAAWRSVETPNVAAWMPGHRRDSWSAPGMRQGLEALILSLLKSTST